MKSTMNWEKQYGRYPRDPRYGHRVGLNYKPLAKNDLYSTIDGFISNKSLSGVRALDSSDNSQTIFVIGGSAAMGYGVRNEETVSAKLEKIINQKSTESSIKVINAACAGWASWTELLYLALELIHFKPKHILQITGWNDFVHSSIGSRTSGIWYRNHDRSVEDLYQSIIGSRDLKSLVSQQFLSSEFFNRIKHIYHTLLGKDLTMSDIRWGHQNTRYKFNPIGVDNLLENLISSYSLCDARSIKYHCFFQPVIYLDNPLDLLPKYMIDWYNKYPGFGDSLSSFYSRLKLDLVENNHNFIIDLSADCLFSRECFIDHCHLSNYGNEVLAQQIHHYVK